MTTTDFFFLMIRRPPRSTLFPYTTSSDLWSNFDQGTLASLGMEITGSKQIAHRVLGKLAIAQENLKKKTSFKEFAKEIGISGGTLSAYKSVEEKFKGIEVPEDWSWTAMLLLSKQENYKAAISGAIEHGLSSAEVIRAFRDKPTKKKTIECPKCHNKLEIK